MSDTGFNRLGEITQEYSRNEFIKDSLDKLKNLPEEEKQKVYDYFQFEIKETNKTKTGYTIIGYPMNIEFGEKNENKLESITNPQTRAVIESLRKNVIKFTKNNKIKCAYPKLEQELNEIIKALPELRSTIGCKQHGEKIRQYIEELKSSQPLLPVTPIPKASKIAKAITEVYSDGSTNIKGVYKDKDGLIVLKYNELENEELAAIGFPKGSKVKGIEAKTDKGEHVNTGNIKFFAHGLCFPEQLAKFSAFSLINSDVLLSATYAERAESKSRFFRPQGVLLACDTKYIHGGGERDLGSDYGKFVSEFKNDIFYNNEREKHRNYVSNLIKTTLNMDDETYKEFIKNNENKAMHEIEPEEYRKKLIQAFSTMTSFTRHADRSYNEMYISNQNHLWQCLHIVWM